MTPRQPAIWFPAIKSGSGTDVFTKRLVSGLQNRGVQAAITWLPHHAEYAPWMVAIPKPPPWTNLVHVNTCLPSRFLPADTPILATLHHCVQDLVLKPYKTMLQGLYHHYLITPMEQRVLTSANRCITVSHYTKKQARLIYPDANFTVIPNGIDTTIFKTTEDKQPHNPFRLLFIGNWSKRKGADLLVPIMQDLGKNFELTYTEGQRRTPPLLKFSRNIRSVVRPSGDEEMAGLYQQADALLFPTRLEGFGLAALEAQACGVPVIATRGSALPEIVADQKTGLLSPQDDVAAFVSNIRTLANRPTLWHKMVLDASIHAKTYFSADKMLDKYLAVYQNILGETPLTL